jgi:hypothetical protein
MLIAKILEIDLPSDGRPAVMRCMRARASELSPGQLFNLRCDPAMIRTRKGRSLIAVDRNRPPLHPFLAICLVGLRL